MWFAHRVNRNAYGLLQLRFLSYSWLQLRKKEKTHLLIAGRSFFAVSLLGLLKTLFVVTEATLSTLFSMFYCMPVARVVNYVSQLRNKKSLTCWKHPFRCGACFQLI